MQSDALVAIVISFAGIILYIAARFEFRFGVAAALATFHDVLAVLGAFSYLDKEITLLVVTALLTLAGYSLTDTVVVFDRIRENLRMRRREQRRDDDQQCDQSSVEPHDRHQFDRRVGADSSDAGAAGRCLHDFSLALLVGRDFRHLFLDLRREPVAVVVAGGVRTAAEAGINRVLEMRWVRPANPGVPRRAFHRLAFSHREDEIDALSDHQVR